MNEHNEFNQTILNSLSAHIAVLDQNGTIRQVNRAWRQFAQENGAAVQLQEGVGLNYFEVCRNARGADAKYAQACLTGLQALLAGDLEQFDLEYPCHGSAEKRWFLMRAVRLDGNEAGLVVSHINITGRVEVEERYQYLASLLEHVSDAIISTDLNFNIQSWNLAAEAIYGWQEYEVLGRQMSEMVPIYHVGQQRDEVIKQFRRDGFWKGEVRQQRKDGVEIDVLSAVSFIKDRSGQVVGVVAVNRDISQRKRTQQALAESQMRLAGIIDSAMDAVITVDADQRIVLFNPAAEIMFGLPVTEAIGQPLDRCLPERFRQAHRRHIADFGRTGVTSRRMGELGSITGLRASGEAFPIEASISQVQIAGQQLFTVILRDITERKQAEEALYRSERVLQLFVEYAPAAIAMFDREMRYIAASRRFLLDYDLGDRVVTGHSHYEIFSEIPERWREIYRRCLAGAIAKADEDPFPRADGKLDWVRWEIHPWYEPGGEIGGIILFSEVVTERKLAEEARRTSEARLTLAIKATGLGIYEHAVPLGDDTYHSERWADILGYTLAELPPPNERLEWVIGRAHPDDLVTLEQAYLDFVEGRTPDYQVEIRLQHKSGHWVYVSAISNAVARDDHKRVTRILGVMEDITAYKATQEQLQRYNERLTILRQIDRGIVAAASLEDIVQPVLQGIRRLIQCTRASIALFELETLEVMISALDTGPNKLDLGRRLPLVRTPKVEQLAAGQVIMIPDLRLHQDPISPETVQQLLKAGLRSALQIPLITQGQLIGILSLTDATLNYFTSEHQEIAGEVANQLAVAIHQHRLREQIQRHAQDLEQRVAERTAELEQQYRRQAALEERQHLARELHDVVSQSLFSARVIAETLPRLWERNPELVRSSLTDLHHLTRGALAEMRTLLLELRPAALEEVSLAELLRQLTDGIAGRSRIEIDLRLVGQDALPVETKIGLYRMAQEALNNVVKHARAGRIVVQLWSQADQIQLQISDDGRGFNPAEVPPGHLGLHIMAERAQAIGARLTVSSLIDSGTVVNIVWPDPSEQDGSLVMSF